MTYKLIFTKVISIIISILMEKILLITSYLNVFSKQGQFPPSVTPCRPQRPLAPTPVNMLLATGQISIFEVQRPVHVSRLTPPRTGVTPNHL